MLTTVQEQIRAGKRSRFTVYVLLPASGAGVVLLLLFGYSPEIGQPRTGEVQFIDVGQGDSILIRSPVSRSVMLVDGGGTVTFRKPGEEWKTRRDPYDVGRKAAGAAAQKARSAADRLYAADPSGCGSFWRAAGGAGANPREQAAF
ncbi:hypothetical protein LJK88_19190 [Paenibacillus sp. P26]|nr:hypothetical protein LJK88_19190 [Paenibacillus sp. P26]